MGPAGVEERGKGIGGILQEPGRSETDQRRIAKGTVAKNGARPTRLSPPCGSELGDGRLERGTE